MQPVTSGENIGYRPKDADLARDPEADGDAGVDVAAADVRYHPDDRRHAEAERERDLDGRAAEARPTADQQQQQRADELGQQRQPELGRFHVLQARRRHLLYICSETARTYLLGPFHGAIAVPSVTRCRCCRRGHRCAGGVSSDIW